MFKRSNVQRVTVKVGVTAQHRQGEQGCRGAEEQGRRNAPQHLITPAPLHKRSRGARPPWRQHHRPQWGGEEHAYCDRLNARLKEPTESCRDSAVKVIWTRHAEERQREWERKLGIARQEIEELLVNPEQVGPGDLDASVAQARRGNGLLRVPFVEVGEGRKVLTVYWTSRVEKYWREE